MPVVPTTATSAEMARGRMVAELIDRRFSRALFLPAAGTGGSPAPGDHPEGSPGALRTLLDPRFAPIARDSPGIPDILLHTQGAGRGCTGNPELRTQEPGDDGSTATAGNCYYITILFIDFYFEF